MRFQIGAMTVGDVLDRGFKIMLHRLPALYLTNLIILGPLIAVQMFMPEVIAQLASGQLGVGTGMSSAQAGFMVGGFFLVVCLTFLLQPLGTAAVLHIISQDFLDRPATLGSALRFALGRFLPLLGTMILVGLIMMVGLFLCVVPMFFFMVWYIFATQVVVVENISGTNALNRSKTLTDGYRWKVLGMWALVYLAIPTGVNVVSGVLGAVYPPYDQIPVAKRPDNPFDTGLTMVPRYPAYYVNTLVTQLLHIVVQTYQEVCLTLLYFDLRIRKEGFDLEMMARSQDEPPLQAEILD